MKARITRRKKKITAAERVAAFKPTYFFGYGSLLVPAGIHGRGMLARYKLTDLRTCTLNGYARSMCAYFGGRNFYGLLEDEKAHCNGTVFKISDWYDYRALLTNEGATSKFRKFRTYWPVDVTKLISSWDVPKGHRVITLVCRHSRSNWGRTQRSYIKFCADAAGVWGEEFTAEFLNTGGVPYSWKSMKKIAKENNIQIW